MFNIWCMWQMMLLFQAFKLYSRYNAPLNKCAFSSEKYALLTRNTRFCQKSVLLVRICSYIATPMTMGNKVIKHPCLQINTPADLKTLQWVWARNKVTAYKAPLYTKNDQELKPFIWKLSLERSYPGVHITCLIRKSCIWILNKAGPPKSMQLNSKQMISKQLPSAQGSLLLHQICSESVHLAHIRWTNFRHN